MNEKFPGPNARSETPDDLRRRVADLESDLATEREKNGALLERLEAWGIDALTGLLRREEFERKIAAYIAKPEERREDMPERVSALFVDIDDFKAVNDTYGHDAGDAVLRAVASVLRSGVREVDFAGRLGGEEMAIALVGATEEQAAASAEILRQKIAELRFDDMPKLKVTASFGVATADLEHPHTSTELLTEADEAMYFSKQNGKDRITTASQHREEKGRQYELPLAA